MNKEKELSCCVRKEVFNYLSNYNLLLLLLLWLLLVLLFCSCSSYCAVFANVAVQIVSEVELLCEKSLNDVFNKTTYSLLLLLLLMMMRLLR